VRNDDQKISNKIFMTGRTARAMPSFADVINRKSRGTWCIIAHLQYKRQKPRADLWLTQRRAAT